MAPRNRKSKAARRRIGDSTDLQRFRDGVRLRAVRIPNRKREAARRACRAALRDTRRDDR